jgi:thiosulfate dehydrogenase [quinone] large subunit
MGATIGRVNDRSNLATDLARGRAALVVLRTFLGIVYFSNGLAKLFEFHTVALGPWKFVLLNRGDAFGIQSGNTASSPGFLRDLGMIVITYWDVFQWLVTFAELAIGIGLILGLLSRIALVGGLLLSVTNFMFSLGAEVWAFDYLFEPALLLVLLIGPPLRGLDSRLPWRRWRILRSSVA